MEHPMQRLNDLSRSLAPLKQRSWSILSTLATTSGTRRTRGGQRFVQRWAVRTLTTLDFRELGNDALSALLGSRIGRRQALGCADQADQPAGRGELPIWVNCRQSMTRCQRGELIGQAIEEWISDDNKRLDPPLHEGRKGRVDLTFGASVYELEA